MNKIEKALDIIAIIAFAMSLAAIMDIHDNFLNVKSQWVLIFYIFSFCFYTVTRIRLFYLQKEYENLHERINKIKSASEDF